MAFLMSGEGFVRACSFFYVPASVFRIFYPDSSSFLYLCIEYS
ncbi:hypothetical protein Bache_2037 [Bacteroides helcogenes P 36-108]|uniref:Uncharacterized protein n=1 Tax=Bacteroides helcogenes (strain ATCC 35417 / DSM 20613 / JCM 6297 / CCUG 15421 / P 36-108) TaxID=693979 RepID=E6SQS6_BACT6|nr:hypothetical protein Bache_2037 [Bacteroides helcogenes P 36-108]